MLKSVHKQVSPIAKSQSLPTTTHVLRFHTLLHENIHTHMHTVSYLTLIEILE